jgi:hypothetical protein
MEISSQRVLPNTFFDALDGGRASQFLEAEEIDFAIENHSVRQHGIHSRRINRQLLWRSMSMPEISLTHRIVCEGRCTYFRSAKSD